MRKTMRKRKTIGKKKVLSLILGFVLCLSVMQEPIYTKAADEYTETGSTAVSSGNEGDVAGTIAGDEGAVAETSAENEGEGAGTSEGNEGTQTEATVSGNAATQNAEVLRVQGLIDAQPALEELQAADAQTQQEIYETLQAAYDAYEALTGEEQELLFGADCFETLFGWFNAQVSTQDTVAENVHRHCHCGKHTAGRCPFSGSSYVTWEAITDTDRDGKISVEELQTQIQNLRYGAYARTAAGERCRLKYQRQRIE